MGDLADRLTRFVESCGGIVPLKPTFVRRAYCDAGRLSGKKPGATKRRSDGLFVSERWIASSTEAANPNPIPGEGLSVLAGFRPRTTLRDAVAALPERLLGPRRAEAHEGQFRVLTKLLDPYEAIYFHYHARDEDVWANPEHFRGQRFGKDEAYYFLDAPKGPTPYTHVGLFPGVGREDLVRAMKRGRDALLEISPCFVQKIGHGYFVPAGVIHSPGTALTLEVQQPSDVGTVVDLTFAGRGASGRRDLDAAAEEALRFADLQTSSLPDILERFALTPQRIDSASAGIEEWWIVPPSVTGKFRAKRVLVRAASVWRQEDCFALLVWAGRGRIGPHEVKAGDEFFVSHQAACEGVSIDPADGCLEMFAFFAGAC